MLGKFAVYLLGFLSTAYAVKGQSTQEFTSTTTQNFTLPPTQNFTLPPTQKFTLPPTISFEKLRDILSRTRQNISAIERKFTNDTKLLEKIFEDSKNLSRSYQSKVISKFIGDDDKVKREIQTKNGSHTLSGLSGLIKTVNSRNNFTFVRCRGLIDSDLQSVPGFEDAEWNWTLPEDVVINGLRAKNYSAPLQVKVGNSTARLSIHAIIFSDSGTIDYAGEKVAVYPGAVKLSYLVNNWPFKSSNSSLFYSLTVSSSGQGVSNDDLALKIGSGLFNASGLALVDGNVAEIKIRYIVDQDSENGTQAAIIFEFPYFNSSLYYDPISSLRSDEMQTSLIPASVSAGSVSTLNAILLSAVLSFMIGNFFI
jgi:hypothetical protein